MKLNDASPQQHLAILVLAGVFIFINTIDMFKGKARQEEKTNGPAPRFAETLDDTGEVISRQTKFQNPKLSWYERIFCRGYQRSGSCSFRFLHPFATESEAIAQGIPEGAPKNDHVVNYRGDLGKNTAFSRNIEAPEAYSPPAKEFDAPNSFDVD